MQNQNQTIFPTNYYFEIVGNLGHDNRLFDRTCPNCGGMFSSFQMSVCNKCNVPLVAITTGEGKAMAISEGTIYPAFGPKQKERNQKAINNRKNGMQPVYRFKVFSFADENGMVSLPQDHQRMKKGAMVKVSVRNHEIVPSWFLSSSNVPRVELMMQIYPQYGDVAVVLKDAQAQAATQPVTIGPDGQPIPMDTSQEAAEIARLEARIAELRGQSTPQAAPTPTTTPTQQGGMSAAEAAAFAEEDTPPWNDGAQTQYTGGNGEVDPFDIG